MDTSNALHTPAGLGLLFRSVSYRNANEEDLEIALAQQLREIEVPVQRQVHLGSPGRIDLVASLGTGMLGLELGIEVKVGGAPYSVRSQLERYAASSQLDQLMIVSTQRRHLVGLPERMAGKPLHLVLVRVA